MTTFVCKSKLDIKDVCNLLQNRELPITVNITKGADRSIEQNKLLFKWLTEAAEQLQDETIEQKRGYCKLHFGVPIMRENEVFRESYDRVIRPLPYEQKIEIMMIPIDLPVTRLMTTKQMKDYMDQVYIYYSGLGVRLTNPDENNTL